MLEIKKSHQDQTLATDKMVQNLVSYGEVVIVLFSLAFSLLVRKTRLYPLQIS